jgi:hypothetical protein
MWGSDGDTAKAGACARVIAIGCATLPRIGILRPVEPANHHSAHIANQRHPFACGCFGRVHRTLVCVSHVRREFEKKR